MNSVLFDPVSGVSGDMILGALLDLGADIEDIRQALCSAGITTVDIAFERRTDDHGFESGRCIVEAPHEHHHRNLSDMLGLVERADVAPRVRTRATAILTRLAKAEAKVHGVTLEQVHFHEVGGLDTIADILGACVALECLGVERLFCSGFRVGRGVISCAHGILPVPAPATVELLKGWPVRQLDIDSELTTPTGAAILTALCEPAGANPTGCLVRLGTGAGSRTFPERPNVVRAFLFSAADSEEMTVLETDIDDQNPEVTAAVADLLRDAGAADVVLTPVIMKRGRNGVRLMVLASADKVSELTKLIFTNTSTLGIRVHDVKRFTLPREATTADTPWGSVAAKKITRAQGVEIVPEAESCRQLAATGVASMREIMDAARHWQPHAPRARQPKE